MIHILVVEDNPDLIEVVCLLLEQDDHVISQALSGQQCLAWLRNGNRGLIFMDIMMPELSGLETLHVMTTEGLIEGNLICIMSASPFPEEESARFAKHIIGYIKKPFKQNCLSKIVQTYKNLVHGFTHD